MAGGGVKAGVTYGQTDDYGYNLADADGNPIKPQPGKERWTPGTMHIHDLNATILHQLGIDHKRLTYRYQSRDFRLPDDGEQAGGTERTKTSVLRRWAHCGCPKCRPERYKEKRTWKKRKTKQTNVSGTPA